MPQFFKFYIAMSSDSASESGSEYLPGSLDDQQTDANCVSGELSWKKTPFGKC